MAAQQPADARQYEDCAKRQRALGLYETARAGWEAQRIFMAAKALKEQ